MDSLKEQIEKKLGCTIEEHIKGCDAEFCRYRGYEADCMIPPILTVEELDYMIDYVKALARAEKIDD